MTWFWWWPTIAVVLHIAEEFLWPGGFPEWDRSYRPKYRKSITPTLHVIANALLVVLCLNVGLAGMGESGAVVAGYRLRSSIPAGYAAHGWLVVAALLSSNAVFHLVGTIRMRRYSPGVVTGMLLYVPLAVFGFWHFVTRRDVSPGAALLMALLGGSYHLWAGLMHSMRARARGTA